jgi:hypothetical protein
MPLENPYDALMAIEAGCVADKFKWDQTNDWTNVIECMTKVNASKLTELQGAFQLKHTNMVFMGENKIYTLV